MNTKAIIVLLIFGFWTLISWQRYTCDLNGFCFEESPTPSFASEIISEEKLTPPIVDSSADLEVEKESLVEPYLPNESELATARLMNSLPFSITFMYKSDLSYFRQKTTEELQAFCSDVIIAHQEIHIVGHADTRGEYSKGYVLGLKRSGVVRDKLVKCGCPTELLLTSSKGGESPISGMKTVEERAKNRRVEITIPSE